MQSLIISGKTFRKTKTAFLIVLIFSSLFLTGCGKFSRNKPFSTKLALIDGYIAQNEVKDALSSLKKSQKSAYSVAQRLSIVKRYRNLGATELAEKFLLESMKNLPDSIELKAVYVQELLAENRVEEALPFASALKGTWFDSLYVETCLRQVSSPELFYEERFSDMYQSAYKATGDARWLRNSALILAANGRLKDAARLHPGMYSLDSAPLMWTLLDYDAENYNRCIEGCNYLIQNCPEDRKAAILLCSDAWLQNGDIGRADDFWLAQIEAGKENAVMAEKAENNSGSEYAPAEIYKNAIQYAVDCEDYAEARDLLITVTDLYPDYVPALVSYVNFAIEGDADAKRYASDRDVFRVSRMKTLAMEEHDSIPRIPLADALAKLEQALSEHYSPELLVEYTRVRWQMENTDEGSCLSELWSLLEQTRVSNRYEPYMIHWAACWLSAHHNEVAATGLFSDYLISVYGTDDAVSCIDELDNWECELAAWFALKDGRYENARTLYENRINERDTMPDESVLMNCASVYTAEHNYLKALELYSSLAPLIKDPVVLSEIQYRIGVIQYDLHEKRNALLSLTYSVKLNPDNHRARLLLKQVE